MSVIQQTRAAKYIIILELKLYEMGANSIYFWHSDNFAVNVLPGHSLNSPLEFI